MSKLFYKNINIDSIISSYRSDAPTDINVTIPLYYTNCISSAVTNNIKSPNFNNTIRESPKNLGYCINNIDISKYFLAAFWNPGTTASRTVPTWCNYVGVILVGGGGGGGRGPSNIFTGGPSTQSQPGGYTNSIINPSVNFAIVEVNNQSVGQRYSAVYLTEQQGAYYTTYRRQTATENVTVLNESLGAKDTGFGMPYETQQTQGQGIIYNNAQAQITTLNGAKATIQNTALLQQLSQYSGGNPANVIKLLQQNGANISNVVGSQAYITYNYPITNTIGSVGQSGIGGSYVYFISSVVPDSTINLTIGGGGAISNTVSSTTGGDTRIQIDGKIYTAGGGGLNTTTTSEIISYGIQTSNISGLSIIKNNTAQNAVYQLTSGTGGLGGNQATTGTTNSGQAGVAGQKGLGIVYFFAENPI
jgi:hypothetical protein